MKWRTEAIGKWAFLTASILSSCSGKSDEASSSLFEEEVTSKEKLTLINQLSSEFKYLAELSHGKSWAKETMNNFHIVDIDLDGDHDVLYTGWSGAEPACVRIFENRAGSFAKVLDEEQTIDKFNLTDQSIEMVILDPGCCGTLDVKVKSYRISRTTPMEIIRTREVHFYADLVKSVAANAGVIDTIEISERTPIHIEPKSDTTDFDLGPFVLDGNSFAQTTQKCFGYIVHDTINQANERWLLVDVPNNCLSREISEMDNESTLIRGWIKVHIN